MNYRVCGLLNGTDFREVDYPRIVILSADRRKVFMDEHVSVDELAEWWPLIRLSAMVDAIAGLAGYRLGEG